MIIVSAMVYKAVIQHRYEGVLWCIRLSAGMIIVDVYSSGIRLSVSSGMIMVDVLAALV